MMFSQQLNTHRIFKRLTKRPSHGFEEQGKRVFISGEQRGPPRGFREQGKKGIYFRGTGEQRPNFEGKRGTKTILGNREHKKAIFNFWGNRGTSQFISGETREQVPPGRASTKVKF